MEGVVLAKALYYDTGDKKPTEASFRSRLKLASGMGDSINLSHVFRICLPGVPS